MKIRYKRIDIWGDMGKDKPKDFLEDEYRFPYVVQYKKHWWSFWHYVTESLPPYNLKIPKLFFGEFDKEKVLLEIEGYNR